MAVTVQSSQKMQHGTWIEIRVSRLLNNLKAIRTAAGQDVHTMAVVKANAYGHGLTEIAKHLAPEVHYFGVSSLKEALELKEKHGEAHVFIFGRLFGDELPAAMLHGITLSISSFEEAEEISKLSLSLGRTTFVHIKVDTGMGRLGIPFRNAVAEIQRISALQGIVLEGLYTHFPTAEKRDGFSSKQVYDFSLLVKSLYEKGIVFRYRHAANSAGMITERQLPLFNLCRPGLTLYGIYPDQTLKTSLSVSPILSLKSRIIHVKRLGRNESSGYGRDFVASEPVTLAVLPVGYSHGYPFRASNKASVLYRGEKYPLAGRVSMDYLTVNLGNTPARAGDEVTLIGEEGNASIRAEELAEWAGTIPYEIVTRLLPSIPRYYY